MNDTLRGHPTWTPNQNAECRVQSARMWSAHHVDNIIINMGVPQYRVINAHPYSARNVLDSFCTASNCMKMRNCEMDKM